jgi:hypothetical protein
MTRDEIMALSADELKIAITEARGYKWRRWEGMPGVWQEALRRDDDFVYVAVKVNRKITVSFDMPDWTGDIKVAFDLLEQSGVCYDMAKREDGQYLVSTYTDHSDFLSASADTLPMAIARCWLIWHEETRK